MCYINALKYELYYHRKSKMLYILMLAIVLFTAFSGYAQFQKVNNTARLFMQEKAQCEANGEDVQAYLKAEFKVTQNGNMTQIENTLKYLYMQYQASVIALNPINSINQLFSSMMFIIFPFLVALYAIQTARYDVESGTHKIKLIKHTFWLQHAIKVSTVVLIALMGMLIAIFEFVVLQLIFRSMITTPDLLLVKGAMLSDISFIDKAPSQLLFICLILVLYSLIFYVLTVVLNSKLTPLLLLFSYMLLIPALGKYDIKSILLNLFHRLFNTNASTFIAAPSSGEAISLFGLIGVYLLYIIALFTLMLIAKRKLKY